MRHEFRFAGTGGQGLITAAIIMANAALKDGNLAVQSQSYGPEARGGSSKAEAIVSDKPIHFTRVTHPNVFLVMSQQAADKFCGDLTKDSVVITDSLFVKDLPGFTGKRYDLPITHTAKDQIGKTLFANIVACGALQALTKCVSVEKLEEAVKEKVPARFLKENMAALHAGMDLINNQK
jgi:2-oxoglutarate ferredoxin oxidoreductase subunit gamma